VSDRVLVIIVTYNGMKWIDVCLESIYNSSIPADIFIVDNNSSDKTVSYLKLNHKYLKLVESKINLGFGKANNVGLAFAHENRYDYVYLLNQDAWIFEFTLEKLINIQKRYLNFGILSPMQMYSDCQKLDANFLLCCPSKLLEDLYFNNVQDIYSTKFVMAAHWLISKECLKIVGGFSPSFPHYGEDHNFLHRAQYLGYQVGIVPSAKSVHDREFRSDSKELIARKMYIESIVKISNPNRLLFKQLLIQPFTFLMWAIKLKSAKPIFNGLRFIYQIPLFVRNRFISYKRSFLS
jgi:N-acetylglucosaminyl-diphospho-decaprenol L-rhamnosyltransferase